MAGVAVTKVVHRCDEAKENKRLDLSGCQLTQVPDAIYLLMKNTRVEVCDLSGNLIRRIPSKLPTKFPYITELNLGCNRLSSLPDELKEMKDLKRLDISTNSFTSLPDIIYGYSKLQHLNMEKNEVKEFDVNNLKSMLSLVEVNFQDNPLTDDVYNQLLEIRMFNVLITPRDRELDSVD
ncbi:leucine-rich repeat-containing protein 20 [Patella vulgata]|uniref:leucine-rich repeat-containing protein 20 n=1 Tax=Patella vulgata TaxID=6465 RepID=UPI00217F5D6B|nr:leucine-rich repeat-containing protein 20 [Patella vulgata]